MLANFSFRTIVEYLPLFGQGLVATLWLSVLSFAGALAIGIIACGMNLQRSRLLRAPAKVYIDAVRATPLLAQLYFLYFGLPRLGFILPELVVGVLALSLNSGAYIDGTRQSSPAGFSQSSCSRNLGIARSAY